MRVVAENYEQTHTHTYTHTHIHTHTHGSTTIILAARMRAEG